MFLPFAAVPIEMTVHSCMYSTTLSFIIKFGLRLKCFDSTRECDTGPTGNLASRDQAPGPCDHGACTISQ